MYIHEHYIFLILKIKKKNIIPTSIKILKKNKQKY